VVEMMGKTHLIGGLALGFAAFRHLDLDPNLTQFALYFGGVALGALLPDVDHHNAPISLWLFPIHRFVAKRWSHRTMTHSLIFMAVATLFVGLLSRNLLLMLGLGVGLLSHLVLDLFNPTGVPLLYPFKENKFRIAKITTGNALEQGFLVVFVIVVLSYL
jgi:inner membrane protein